MISPSPIPPCTFPSPYLPNIMLSLSLFKINKLKQECKQMQRDKNSPQKHKSENQSKKEENKSLNRAK